MKIQFENPKHTVKSLDCGDLFCIIPRGSVYLKRNNKYDREIGTTNTFNLSENEDCHMEPYEYVFLLQGVLTITD